MAYYSPKIACNYFKVTEQTLREWANENKIQFQITKGGHRRYYIPDYIKDKSSDCPSEEKKDFFLDFPTNVIYARVSSKKQEKDLERQIRFARKSFPTFKVIQDIGSGINYKRKGFLSLVEGVIKGQTKEIVITNKDRLSRFSTDFIIWLFEQYGCKTTILSDNEHEGELHDDLMEVLTVFTARYYGKRKYKNLEDKNLSYNETEGIIPEMFWSE